MLACDVIMMLTNMLKCSQEMGWAAASEEDRNSQEEEVINQ